MANTYVDKLTIGENTYPVYAQSLTDGSSSVISFDTLNVVGKYVVINVPTTGWSTDSERSTITIKVSGITEDMVKNGFCVPGGDAIDSAGSIVWSKWVLQKKAYDKFSIDGVIETFDGEIRLNTSTVPTTTFYIAIMEVEE